MSLYVNTEIAESDNSGPIPSPVINDILYMILNYARGNLIDMITKSI